MILLIVMESVAKGLLLLFTRRLGNSLCRATDKGPAVFQRSTFPVHGLGEQLQVLHVEPPVHREVCKEVPKVVLDVR